MTPSENDIRAVMAQTGMAYIQARNHLICRAMLRDGVRK